MLILAIWIRLAFLTRCCLPHSILDYCLSVPVDFHYFRAAVVVVLLDDGSGSGIGMEDGNDEDLLEGAAVRDEDRVPKVNRTAERDATTTRDKMRLRLLLLLSLFSVPSVKALLPVSLWCVLWWCLLYHTVKRRYWLCSYNSCVTYFLISYIKGRSTCYTILRAEVTFFLYLIWIFATIKTRVEGCCI